MTIALDSLPGKYTDNAITDKANSKKTLKKMPSSDHLGLLAANEAPAAEITNGKSTNGAASNGAPASAPLKEPVAKDTASPEAVNGIAAAAKETTVQSLAKAIAPVEALKRESMLKDADASKSITDKTPDMEDSAKDCARGKVATEENITKDATTESPANSQVAATEAQEQAQALANAIAKDLDDYNPSIPEVELAHLALLEVLPYLPPAAEGHALNIELINASTTALASTTGTRNGSQITLHVMVGSEEHGAQPRAPPNTRSASPSVNDKDKATDHDPLPNPFPTSRRSSSITVTAEVNEHGGVTFKIVMIFSRFRAWFNRKILRRAEAPPVAASIAATTYVRHQAAMSRRNHLIDCDC